MRRIALINQKGGVGKTTTTVNLGAALARAGRRVVLVDLDPQANLSLHLDRPAADGAASTYGVLTGAAGFGDALRDTATPGLRVLPSHIDLSGAELELANAFGRELLLREALERWESEQREASGQAPADYVLIDCPPSLGLLSVNGLVAAREVLIAVQTEFFALQGMSKLVDVLAVLRRRLNPALETCGILACLYDSRLKLAREVLAEIRRYFPGQVFRRAIAKNVKLAEAPSYGRTIFEYAPGSPGASDYEEVARELLDQEAARDPELAQQVEADAAARSPHDVRKAAAEGPARRGAAARSAAANEATSDEAPPSTATPTERASPPRAPASAEVDKPVAKPVARRAPKRGRQGAPARRPPAGTPPARKVPVDDEQPAASRTEHGTPRPGNGEPTGSTPGQAQDERSVTVQPAPRRSAPRRSPTPRVVGDISLD
jgi:chromosome partitioning protein